MGGLGDSTQFLPTRQSKFISRVSRYTMSVMEKKTMLIIKAIEVARTIDVKSAVVAFGKRYEIISFDPLFINAYPGRKQYALVEKHGVVVFINNSEVFE